MNMATSNNSDKTLTSLQPSQTQQQQQQQTEGPSSFAYFVAFAILGTSAGFTLYTRKTGGMLRSIHYAEEMYAKQHPKKTGPLTKEEWDKVRPRFDKDEFI
jgi:hypothetical protein